MENEYRFIRCIRSCRLTKGKIYLFPNIITDDEHVIRMPDYIVNKYGVIEGVVSSEILDKLSGRQLRLLQTIEELLSSFDESNDIIAIELYKKLNLNGKIKERIY